MTDERREGWQPIETAPKDGTVIDIWFSGQAVWGKDGHWQDGRIPDCWWGVRSGGGFGDFRGETEKRWVHEETDVTGTSMDIDPDGCVATHWMPLPNPPEVVQDAG